MAEIRQKIISCSNKHYYDANKYASCPYCEAPEGVSHTISPGSGAPMNLGGFEPTIDPHASGVSPAGGGIGPTAPAPQAPRAGADRMVETQFVDVGVSGAAAPVVGWLVEIAGKCCGTDYKLHTGYNNIGRERGDICLRQDETVSAENDSTVTYVPQTRQFYVSHLQGKNVVLVNDMPVPVVGTELKNYDVVTIGRTKLLFIGLCGERFDWKNEDEQS